MEKKITVLTISDHPYMPTGVGTQTKYVIDALLESGKFKVVSMGGGTNHPTSQPTKDKKWGEDFIIYPVKGYGNQEEVRGILRMHKPDVLYFMTDPRFYEWLWSMENEIRPLCPMVYYHVWDNYPIPLYNKPYYLSNDLIVSISKVTQDIVETLTPDIESVYLPHAVNTDIFKKIDEEEKNKARRKFFAGSANAFDNDKFVFFWNNRNARRKQPGSLIFWFKTFLDKVGHDKACLVMHTEAQSEVGTDIVAIIRDLGLDKGQVMISTKKIPAEVLSNYYNVADCVVNISDAEGFGLGTLEALACETPIIVNMTGGLQEQVTDGEHWFGIGLKPTSRGLLGSVPTPYIYEDRLDELSVVTAFETMFNTSAEDRAQMGAMGREHVLKNYNFKDFGEQWVNVMLDLHEKHGSWKTRKGYDKWEAIII